MSTFLASLVGAAGSVLSAYIALKVRAVATISNGRLTAVENDIKLIRLILAHREAVVKSEDTTES